MNAPSQPQLSICSRTDCHSFESSRQASTRTQVSRPHLEVEHIPGNSPGNSTMI